MSVTTGSAPVVAFSSAFRNTLIAQAQATSPVADASYARTFLIQIIDLEPYPDEAFEISIPIELSGIIDPIFPAPIAPVDFAGLDDPTVAPTLAKSNTSGGYLTAGTYRYSYAAWKGSISQATAPSPTADITLTSENTVTLTYPTISGAYGYLVYREDF